MKATSRDRRSSFDTSTLHFAFLDPYNLEQLPFSIIEKLASVQRMDMLIHVSVLDLQRNIVGSEPIPLAMTLDGARSQVELTMEGQALRWRHKAQPGGKTYGRLSVLAGWRSEARMLFDVAASAFVPPPKVTSTLVELVPRTVDRNGHVPPVRMLLVTATITAAICSVLLFWGLRSDLKLPAKVAVYAVVFNVLVVVVKLALAPHGFYEVNQKHDIDDQPLAIEDVRAGGDTSIGSGRGGRRSGAIDLSLDGVVIQGDESGSLVFAEIDAAPAKPTIEELEGRVADDPDDPEAHQALGEALIEAGERERGVVELDLATTGFETRGNLPQAQDLVDEILRLDPNSVRHRQKQVEFAFKSGDKVKLIDAYVELADTLLRSDLPDKARAVYKRVAEHDPTNERAKAALAMLAPVATPPPEPPAKPKAKVRDTEGRTAARDAKMKVRDEAAEAGDFVDLSAMILDEDLPERDTRMKVADEEPTGDEERDFQEMLARFKQGIDENIDEGDFQSHYDLGVAFKEMGLLDEAIAELQKALRSPDGKLKSSEALGVCFIDKGAYVVAESILRRALDLPASSDQERLGILYWLGRALEELGKRVEARELYGRVFAVDIRFRDVGERSKALAKAK